MEKIRMGLGSVIAFAAVTLLAGCQCTPPVRECVETSVSKEMCVPAKVVSCPISARTTKTVTEIRRTETACAALPPVGEITVVRSCPTRTNMVFVSVRPSDDRCFNVESRNFERPWPWGAYGMGSCEY